MLSTKILKLRLSRIEKGKEHLSTQDRLMLVSMDSPDLSANFILRLFKMTLPKQWKFQHETEEDIFYNTQLIQLIEDEFIPAYEFHARKHAWYEQCLMYRLNFITPEPTQQQINVFLRHLDQCLDQLPKIELLHYFSQKYPTAQHAIALAKAYAGAQQYNQAIQQYEWAQRQSTQPNEVAFYGYIECLLDRRQCEYKVHVSDVEYALDLLCKYDKPIDQKSYKKLLDRAITALLPQQLLQTRAIETNVLSDVGRGLNSLGKSLGGIFGARDFYIPYSKELIASAPQLLHDHDVFESLSQSQAMQSALQRLLSSSEIDSSERLLKLLWISIQQDPDILKSLQPPIDSAHLIQSLSKIEPIEQQALDLGQLQLILEQGLSAYLGEGRLNKQHPERHHLYECRDEIVQQMIDFAVWFYRDIVEIYLEQQNLQLQQVKKLLIGRLPEIALSSGLFAYQFEHYQRVQALFDWMKPKLEKGNDFEKMQAVWVALREARYFDDDSLITRVQPIQQKFAEYKSIRDQQIFLHEQVEQEKLEK